MERLKVVLLGVIAVALWLQLADGWMPVAHADPGSIVCNAWYKEMIGGMKGEEKVLAMSRTYAAEVSAWMQQNPGDPVFRTTLVQGAGMAYVDIMCVR